MDQKRFSQRVTHFVDLHQQQRQASIDNQIKQQQLQQQQHMGNSNSQSKIFIRPMSPVSVDQQHQYQTESGYSDPYNLPLSHQPAYHQQLASSPSAAYNTREIAIRDPYCTEPVTFSVIDPQGGSNSPGAASDIPLHSGAHYPYHTSAVGSHSDYSINLNSHYVDDSRYRQ
jgi:hypothetical protein